MMTFILAAAVLVAALWIAAALDGATAQPPSGGLASRCPVAGLLGIDHAAPLPTMQCQRD